MDPFLGEIRVFGFSYAPTNWAFCAGQLVPIVQNTALFSLLGTQFGGDGVRTFGLPNLQGNVANGRGQGPGMGTQYTIGLRGGVPQVTLLANQLASHIHSLNASTLNGVSTKAAGQVLATPLKGGGRGQPSVSDLIYSPNPNQATSSLDQRSIAPSGGNGAHNNVQPGVTMNFCIALTGIFPQRP